MRSDFLAWTSTFFTLTFHFLAVTVAVTFFFSCFSFGCFLFFFLDLFLFVLLFSHLLLLVQGWSTYLGCNTLFRVWMDWLWCYYFMATSWAGRCTISRHKWKRCVEHVWRYAGMDFPLLLQSSSSFHLHLRFIPTIKLVSFSCAHLRNMNTIMKLFCFFLYIDWILKKLRRYFLIDISHCWKLFWFFLILLF